RWELRLRAFNFVPVHRPGLGNIADFLSRHPMKIGDTDKVESDEYVNAITQYAIPKRVSKDEILSVTLKDKTMIKLKQMVSQGHFAKNDSDVKDFAKVFSELSISPEGFILRGDSLVIPHA